MIYGRRIHRIDFASFRFHSAADLSSAGAAFRNFRTSLIDKKL